MTSDPLKPDLSLLVKLGSIAVHVEEFMADPHHFDQIELAQLLKDHEVVAWERAMDKMALLPKKRRP